MIRRRMAGGLVVLALAGSITGTALGAPPKQTGNPTLQPGGTPTVGDSIGISNGSWDNNPTKFTYQWTRCDAIGDRRNCVSIAGATSQSYTVVKADANHKLNGVVTATNADGSASADALSPVVLDTVPPVNTARPTISGSPAVGSTLTANNGTWRGAASFAYAWQGCDANGNNCVNISGATGKTYGVRSTDVDRRLRVRVTATNKYGSTNAFSDRTALVAANTQTTTTVVTTTTTTPGNKAPTISFLSLRRVGTKLFARFRACDDSGARVTIVERDNKARALSYQRRFAVTCGTYSRSWLLIPRFRSPGRLVVTLRAQDNKGSLSRIVSRSVRIR